METYNNDDLISWFDGIAESAGSVQTETLRQILELNYGAEYLKKWLGDVKIQDLNDSELESLYTSLVPVANHSDFEPYIQRIADGDSSPLLTQYPVTALSQTSGTTEGRYRYVPFTTQSSQLWTKVISTVDAFTFRAYPLSNEAKCLVFAHCHEPYYSKGGLKVGTVSSHIVSSKELKIQNLESSICSPMEVIYGQDYKQTIYCHLLMGLFFSDQVKYIGSAFAFAIVQAFRDFEELWRELCSDIREGTLSTRISDEKMRKAVTDIISPNPSLASRIEASCEALQSLDWFGVMAALWPNTQFIGCIVTGSMKPYVNKLKHYAGDLPLVGGGYVSSEGFIGGNIDPTSPPENISFTVFPTVAYFEFIPQKQDNDLSDDPIPLSQVKVGQQYEIVLTTFGGLYRYRLGDVVEVVGFYKKAPKLKYIRRGKVLLNITVEKTTEKDLETVIEKAIEVMRKSNTEIIDFTTHAHVADQTGHYIIYLEIEGNASKAVLEECCSAMDTAFLDHGAYVVARRSGWIGPLELRIVERGTFKKIMEQSIADGTTLSQFKTPRSTTKPVILGILDGCTIKTFHSSAYSNSN